MENIYKEEQKYQKGTMEKDVILCLLRKKGYRITKQRENLIEVILEEECASCKEIYYKAARKDSGIGMATIYRMVNLLEEIGALKSRNQYSFCETEVLSGHNSRKEMQGDSSVGVISCTVELEDMSQVELKGKSIKEIFEKGMEVCGYSEGKKVKHIVIRGNRPI